MRKQVSFHFTLNCAEMDPLHTWKHHCVSLHIPPMASWARFLNRNFAEGGKVNHSAHWHVAVCVLLGTGNAQQNQLTKDGEAQHFSEHTLYKWVVRHPPLFPWLSQRIHPSQMQDEEPEGGAGMMYGLDVTYSSSLPFRLAIGDSGQVIWVAVMILKASVYWILKCQALWIALCVSCLLPINQELHKEFLSLFFLFFFLFLFVFLLACHCPHHIIMTNTYRALTRCQALF